MLSSLHKYYIVLAFVFNVVPIWASGSQSLYHNRDLIYSAQVCFQKQKSQFSPCIDTALAQTAWQHALGLMYIQNLPTDKGMLFIFKTSKPRSFWMANTLLPLDMIFVNAQKRIIHIHHHALPYSHQAIDSHGPVRYVVETNAGYTNEHNIHKGMSIAIQS